jgi:small subunit ribosomal protein S20
LGNKSAQKAERAADRRQVRNKSTRSQVKTDIARAEKLIAEGNADAGKAVKVAVSALDKAAAKKVLHNNNAAQHKSRLVKKLNKGAAQPKAKAAPEKAA